MPPTPETTSPLDYQRPPASAPAWPWVLLLAGVIPFGMELLGIFAEAVTGDPPNNLGEFKMYHYWTVGAALLGVAWLVFVLVAFRRRHRWVLLIACGWYLWVCWIGYSFIQDLHEHPAGQYYWSIW
jgi:hypothetical protein